MRSAVLLSMATSGRSTNTVSPSQWLCRLLSTSRIEVVQFADIDHPREHPPLEFRPTARRLEKVTSDMCPAKGQNQLLTLQSQAFVGTVAVTHQHDFDQVFA